ncbi:MAG: anaerobic glycerol-3-phosphate dehydrogenase subunit GlpA [Chloroflexota bacterium]|nr:anaerobic glycerol-3-phosphate dehydrogenase subunit GlpA [Chloroflexota bacterium]
MARTIDTDLLVIGGGATGGGIAWDAALRGLRVLLVEMGDLATGTSGRYHGLLHSGGRYAVRDLESAIECIDENLLLRKIVPQALEDTGGYFVLTPDDDEAYVEPWLAACKQAGIETREISVSAARERERMLNPKIKVVYEVPDGTCDSWDLLHALQSGATAAGAQFLTYHRVEALHMRDGQIVGARLADVRTGETTEVTCAAAVNAAGPWAKQVAALANCHFNMRLSRGAMLAFNIRWVNRVINRLRKPGDGDIFVPVGTVSVTGTTSVKTDDPGDTSVEAWEVQRILSETEPMTPGISRARILRAWGGVRPLYDGSSGDGRDVKRTFTLLDHAQDGAAGFYSIVGGKLTTFRLMAEKTLDVVCQRLGNTAPCATRTTVLPHHEPGKPNSAASHYHELRGRLGALEHGDNPGALICECEIVTDRQIREALASGTVNNLHDLRRDLRVGMGPCQGGFCAYRAAAVRHDALKDNPAHTLDLLGDYVERRFGGMKPLLWGHNLRQVMLNEHIYGRILGLMPGETLTLSPSPSGREKQNEVHISSAARRQINAPAPLSQTPSTAGAGGESEPRVLVIGAGLAGLTAALAAQEAGAVVEVIAQGQGALTLHPGWIETGDVAALAAEATHPYAHTSGALADGLALIERHIGLHETGGWALTGLGRQRSVAYGAGIVTTPIPDGARLLIVGIAGWRDFYPQLIADNLNAHGFHARALHIHIPDLGGNFDNWTIDVAHYLDSADGQRHLLEQVKPHIRDAQVVAFPAVLGFDRATPLAIARALGMPLTEVPTLTPSVPGLRLFRALRSALLEGGTRFTIGPRVTGLIVQDGRVTGATAETSALRPRRIYADSVILATGGIYGGGLESDYQGKIVEVVAGIPLTDVPPLDAWFEQPFTSGAAQPIHAVGVRTDAHLRPLNEDGLPVAPNLFACGRLLAGAQPIATGCTEGVDIASGMMAGQQAVTAEMRVASR